MLADADDTVLQVLPQNVAAEARRLRASYEAQVSFLNQSSWNSFLRLLGIFSIWKFLWYIISKLFTLFQQVMRFARMLAPPQRFRSANSRSVPGTSGNTTSVGAFAGVTTLASKSATQLLDRDAIVTLLLLFFIDPALLNAQRLQVMFLFQINIFTASSERCSLGVSFK